MFQTTKHYNQKCWFPNISWGLIASSLVPTNHFHTHHLSAMHIYSSPFPPILVGGFNPEQWYIVSCDDYFHYTSRYGNKCPRPPTSFIVIFPVKKYLWRISQTCIIRTYIHGYYIVNIFEYWIPTRGYYVFCVYIIPWLTTLWIFQHQGAFGIGIVVIICIIGYSYGEEWWIDLGWL